MAKSVYLDQTLDYLSPAMHRNTDIELPRLLDLLHDISDAIEDASEEDAALEDVTEAKALAANFLSAYRELLIQVDQEQKIRLEQNMALRIQLMQCQLAQLSK